MSVQHTAGCWLDTPSNLKWRDWTQHHWNGLQLHVKPWYYCSWGGAKKLVRCVEGRYERTVFFDTFINRGLQSGTRFSHEHLNKEELEALGIKEGPEKGMFYLVHYGYDPSFPNALSTLKSRDDQSNGENSRKRYASQHYMQQKLWQAITELVGPELGTDSAKRKITVTKAMKSTNTRVVTQVIIEINVDEGPEKNSVQYPSAGQYADIPSNVLSQKAQSQGYMAYTNPFAFPTPKLSKNDTNNLEFSVPNSKPKYSLPCPDATNSIKDSKLSESEQVEQQWGGKLDDLDVDILSSLF